MNAGRTIQSPPLERGSGRAEDYTDPNGLPRVIRRLTSRDEQAWDAYVLGHTHGTPFHLTAWKRSIEETFGYEPVYLAAWEGSRICGVLPLFVINNLLMGRVLISSPFAVYGGVLADSRAGRAAFATHLAELGKEIKAKHVELRNAHPEQCLGFHRLTRYVTFTQSIGPDEAAILESIPRKTRYMVRKALKSDLAMRIQKSDLSAFEELYSRNLRKLGTPSFPSRHFRRLMVNFKEMVDVREVLSGDRVVAAVMTFHFRDHLFPYYGASDPSHNAKGPNNYMYYELMRWGGQNGYRTFDFGRSKKEGSGSYDFKAHWGMMERELPYEILLINRKSLPNYSPTNPRFQLTIRLWQHLPLRVTRALGPALIRLVP